MQIKDKRLFKDIDCDCSKHLVISKKYLYIRTQKTGSTSVQTAFAKYSDGQILNQIHKTKLLVTGHEGLDHLSQFVPKSEFPDIKYLGIVRNPYARIISWYWHEKRASTGNIKKQTFESWIDQWDNRLNDLANMYKFHLIDGVYSIDRVYAFEYGIPFVLKDMQSTFEIIKTKPHNKYIANLHKQTYQNLESIHVNANKRHRKNLKENLELLNKKTIQILQDKLNKDFDFYSYSYNPEDMFNPPLLNSMIYTPDGV